jgi:hypothetical protein
MNPVGGIGGRWVPGSIDKRRQSAMVPALLGKFVGSPSQGRLMGPNCPQSVLIHLDDIGEQKHNVS